MPFLINSACSKVLSLQVTALVINKVSQKIVYRQDFAAYAEACFQKFGDRVKNWITFNEPHTFAIQGYDLGLQAPGRCSILSHLVCKTGNSSTEPYIVAHNVLLSHAVAANIYRNKYQVKLIKKDLFICIILPEYITSYTLSLLYFPI